MVPPDAFTAQTLGTERAGSGVVIRPGRADRHHRLPGHRSRDDLAHHPRRPRRPRPRPRLRLRDRLRPDPGARPAGPAGAEGEKRPRPAARRHRGAGLGGRPPARAPLHGRRAPGIRRLLGVHAGRGDLHRPRPSLLGRRRPDRRRRRAARHRLARHAAAGRQGPPGGPQHGGAGRTCCRRSWKTCSPSAAPTARRGPGSASTPQEDEQGVVVSSVARNGPAQKAGVAGRRPRAGRGRRAGDATCRACGAPSGAAATPAPGCG